MTISNAPLVSSAALQFLWHRALLMAGCILLGGAGSSYATEYNVGPGQDLAEVHEVPWESLEAGDTVLIHARPQPYKAKWVICREGTSKKPIVVRGVSDDQGKPPVIDGRDAVTREALNFWGEERGVIKIGGANRPTDTTPRHIVIENLEIRGGRPPYQFTGRSGETPYAKNAASIFIEKGEDITLRNCVLHNSGNGLFSSPGTRRILVQRCYLYDNGIEGSILEHNNYTSTEGLVYQFNRFGPLREGCLGNNLKDRSAGLVVRYNWIEGGNRALDLVDSGEYAKESGNANYRETFVYGNTLIKLDDASNNQVVHYGGDSGELDQYRQGTLYFFHNTVISLRQGPTTLFRLSSDQERVDCRNNLLYVTGRGQNLAIFGGSGQVDLHTNWLRPGWRHSHTEGMGQLNVQGSMITGDSPRFQDEAGQDFRLTRASAATGTGIDLHASALAAHEIRSEYVPHRDANPRDLSRRSDLGAYSAVLVE